MHATVADTSPAELTRRARQQWIDRCEAAYPKVYRGLIAMGAPPEDAADALQDAFEAALRESKQVDSADGWMFVVAARKWRRARWRHRIFHPLETSRATVPNDRAEAIDLLRELRRLTERQRTVIVARYVLELSQQEIAGLLHIAPGTVAATVHQGTALLRERLSGGI